MVASRAGRLPLPEGNCGHCGSLVLIVMLVLFSYLCVFCGLVCVVVVDPRDCFTVELGPFVS